MRHTLKLVLGAVCALLLLPSILKADARICFPNSKPNDKFIDTVAIQVCLDQPATAERPNLVLLQPGNEPGYLIDQGLKMGSYTILMSTTGTATLMAYWTLESPILTAVGSNYRISKMRFNGDKENRSYRVNCRTVNARPANLITAGEDYEVSDIESILAACGSGHGVFGSRFRIFRNKYRFNGFPVGAKFPGLQYQFSDGMTVVNCFEGDVIGNELEDNTDFDLLFGGARNCNVQFNNVVHRINFAFGGINLGYMETGTKGEWDGRFTGSRFIGNTVRCAIDTCAFGFSITSHIFAPNPENVTIRDAGFVTDNVSEGAQIPGAIDGVMDGEVFANIFRRAQGDAPGYNECRLTLDYVAGHLGFEPQPGYVRVTMDSGNCEYY